MTARHVAPDPDRRVWLEGVGEAERPLDLGREHTGMSTLGFRLYRFRAGQVIRGESEGDEVLVVVFGGRASLGLSSGHTWELDGRASLLDGPPPAVYMPPHHAYMLTAHETALVGYARAPASGRFPPRLLAPETRRVEASGDGGELRHLLAPGEAERLVCLEALTPPGGWAPRLEGGGLERIDYHRLEPAGAFALGRVTDEGGGRALVLAHGDAVLSPSGGAETVAGPGVRLCRLSLLAGAT